MDRILLPPEVTMATHRHLIRTCVLIGSTFLVQPTEANTLAPRLGALPSVVARPSISPSEAPGVGRPPEGHAGASSGDNKTHPGVTPPSDQELRRILAPTAGLLLPGLAQLATGRSRLARSLMVLGIYGLGTGVAAGVGLSAGPERDRTLYATTLAVGATVYAAAYVAGVVDAYAVDQRAGPK